MRATYQQRRTDARMPNMKRMLPLGAAALLLSVSAAGCGGGSSGPSDASVQWADDVCGATLAWKNQLTKLIGNVRAHGFTEESLKTTAASAQAVTDTYAQTLRGLGAPDTNAGQQAKDALTSLAGELSQSAETIRSTLDTSSSLASVTTAVAQAATTLENRIKATMTQIQNSDAKGELKQAFDTADNCASFTGSS
jgi:hypothetical protein